MSRTIISSVNFSYADFESRLLNFFFFLGNIVDQTTSRIPQTFRTNSLSNLSPSLQWSVKKLTMFTWSTSHVGFSWRAVECTSITSSSFCHRTGSFSFAKSNLQNQIWWKNYEMKLSYGFYHVWQAVCHVTMDFGNVSY